IIIIITPQNLFPLCVYFSVRRCIPHSWINHNDQFYAPYDKSWQEDLEFLGDCLVFMLFSGKNRISIQQEANHFIPFTEKEVRPKGRYTHHTLLDFLAGKLEPETSALFAPTQSLLPTFGAVAKEVLNKGRELYAYYHTQETSNPNASLYDIKEFFSGRDAKGKLNPPSKATDERYKDLYASLQESLELLRVQITPKVWQYGFLRE
ncbi:nucleoside 5-triphosphatase RdgB (dHAPTP, dITP,XTP-specific), partial [Helicobacter felis]